MPEVTRRFNVRIPLRDGLTLSADMTLPGSLPAPAVVSRTPYGKSSEFSAKRGATYAKAGYVFLNMDVRGRGDSDGEFQPYRHDGPDGFDVIEWVAAQDWCNGAVATYGGSYLGRIQWLTALEQPPSLRAMVCMVTPSDPFVEIPSGPPPPMHINWHRLVDARAVQYQGSVDWMKVYGHRPLATMDEAAGFTSPNWRDENQHVTLDEYWEPVRYQHRIGEIDLPVLHVSGWYDDEEIGTPANFAAMVAAGRGGQRLLMGPWGHAINSSQVIGEVDFGPGSLIDLDGAVLAFLDEHVKGIEPDKPAAPARIFVMGANEWRDEPSWPPPYVDGTALYLSSERAANSLYGDGRLSAAPPEGDQVTDAWVHDPDRPVPFITGAGSAQIGGPDDYHGVQTRGDVLIYDGDPLTEPIEVIGPVRLIAHVATSAADTDVMAMLLDVHPNGFAQRLCDGMVRLRYRNGFEREELITPGEVYEVSVVMWDTCLRLEEGHRLRLQIASAAFPKVDVNLGTGGDMVTETEGVIARNQLWHTAARPSRLLLQTRTLG
jgi:putative CocE/NonD family hydrolase